MRSDAHVLRVCSASEIKNQLFLAPFNRSGCHVITDVMQDLCLGYGSFFLNAEIHHIGTEPVEVSELF
jgi:hypothetical protein